MQTRPRRSALYMPGSNPRALAKGKVLPADALILDLEDAVAPDHKPDGRTHIQRALADRSGYGQRELIVRVNSLDSAWGEEDLRSMASARPDAILLPKVEGGAAVDTAVRILDQAGAPKELPIHCMIETPRGVLHVEEVADHPRVTCLVLGTSDLTKDLRARHTVDRMPMLVPLTMSVLAARAAGIAVLDGVHLDLADDDGLELACWQGREIGFDGKTLIHPKQIEPANRAFAPNSKTIAWSRKIIDAFQACEAEGKGVVLVDGKLVENLHVQEAKRLIELSEMIKSLEK